MNIGNKSIYPISNEQNNNGIEHGITYRELLIANIAGGYDIGKTLERYDDERANRIIGFADAIIRKLNEEKK